MSINNMIITIRNIAYLNGKYDCDFQEGDDTISRPKITIKNLHVSSRITDLTESNCQADSRPLAIALLDISDY